MHPTSQPRNFIFILNHFNMLSRHFGQNCVSLFSIFKKRLKKFLKNFSKNKINPFFEQQWFVPFPHSFEHHTRPFARRLGVWSNFRYFAIFLRKVEFACPDRTAFCRVRILFLGCVEALLVSVAFGCNWCGQCRQIGLVGRREVAVPLQLARLEVAEAFHRPLPTPRCTVARV